MTSGQTNVMLAHPYDPDKHSAKVVGWWMSEKYDGVRAKWNGEEMESRTGLVYTLPDFLTEQLQSITDEDGNPMELDGELWGGLDTFAFMSGLARRYENNPELWSEVTYMVFDTPDTTIPFEDRVRKVAAALKRAGNPINIKGVKHTKFDPTKMVKYAYYDEEVPMNLEDELKKVEEKGGEGLVLRKPNSAYEFKRSQGMLKVKSWSYKEAVVYGYEAGKEGVSGKMLGMVGSLLVKSDEFGDEDNEDTERKWVNFKVGSGLNDWQRYTGSMKEDLAKSKKWSADQQKKLDVVRRKMKKPIDQSSEGYQNIVETIKTATGKDRSDALHQLNELYTQMPVIGDVVTFRFKELTKDGNPSMPTFVGVRDYE
jgi:DNA ligase 1